MGLLSLFPTSAEKDFANELNRCDKNSETSSLEYKLKMAYCHPSAKSAFWWYENALIKPNTGSDEDIELLHAKYNFSLATSLGSHIRNGWGAGHWDDYYYRNDKGKKCNEVITQELQKQFVALTLPDVDYPFLGAHDKEELVNNIFREEIKMLTDGYPYTSPFITSSYWLAFHYDEYFVENGEDIENTVGKELAMKKLGHLRSYLKDKYRTNYYRSSLEKLISE